MLVTAALATVAQSMGDVKLFCRVAFGEVDKYSSSSPGRYPCDHRENKTACSRWGEGIRQYHLPGQRKTNLVLSLLPFKNLQCLEFDSPIIDSVSKLLHCIYF